MGPNRMAHGIGLRELEPVTLAYQGIGVRGEKARPRLAGSLGVLSCATL